MGVNKKLGKGLSSLLGNKKIIQNQASENNNGLLFLRLRTDINLFSHLEAEEFLPRLGIYWNL